MKSSGGLKEKSECCSIASLPLSPSGDRHGGKRSADMPAASCFFSPQPIAAPHRVRGKSASGMKRRKRRCSAKSTNRARTKVRRRGGGKRRPTICAGCTHVLHRGIDTRTAAESCAVGLVVSLRTILNSKRFLFKNGYNAQRAND